MFVNIRMQWKLESTRECIRAHLLNQLTLEHQAHIWLLPATGSMNPRPQREWEDCHDELGNLLPAWVDLLQVQMLIVANIQARKIKMSLTCK